MIWVVLWALGVIAFFVYFFRKWRVGFLLFVFGLSAFIASIFLQVALTDLPGYADFVAAAERIGQIILIVAVFALVSGLATGAVCTIRQGKAGHRERDVHEESGGAFYPAAGSPLPMARSKTKMLYRASSSVQMESLVEGTATATERVVFIAVFVTLTSFCLVFVGVSLMSIGKLLFMALLPIPAFVVLYRNVRIAWTQYKAAKQKIAARRLS